jgi:hypothetical protein
MVFAVNANESSDKSFEAFQTLAMNINGTSSNSTSSSTGKNGAGAVRLGRPGVAIGLVAVIVGLAL